MVLDAGADGADIRMYVGMDIDSAVVEGAAPGPMVDEDGVTAPTETSTVPTEDPEGRADGDGRAETNSCADDESWPRRVEDDCWVVDGNVIVGRVDGLNLNVAAVVGDVVVGAGG